MTRVDLGYDRGWLLEAPAKSIARIDRVRRQQITEAGRTRERQQYLYDGWVARKPGFNFAAAPGTSPHEAGNAIDTDMRDVDLLAEHGWVRTLSFEPWHFVYYPSRDTHAGETVTLYQRADGVWTIIPQASPIPTVSEEDDMRLYRWNQKQVFGIEQGTVYYIATPDELKTHSAQLGTPTDVDNAGLTAALVRNGVHWDAVEAVLRGTGQGPDGHLWNRLTAEGEAIRGSQLVQTRTLADVLATVKTLDA